MIKIITVGKIKEKYYTDAVNEYLKRLSKYTKIDLIEVKDEDYDVSKTLLTEKNNILKYVDDKDYVITLEIEGEELVETEKLLIQSQIEELFSDKLSNVISDEDVEALQAENMDDLEWKLFYKVPNYVSLLEETTAEFLAEYLSPIEE